ncbi:MAG: hypothetical protein H0X38_17205 [Planctomycetes bacterium]|nr:hypothetical protein [Planctomycetota bacterium]
MNVMAPTIPPKIHREFGQMLAQFETSKMPRDASPFALTPMANSAHELLSKQLSKFATVMDAWTFTLSPATNTALDSLSKQTAAFATAMGASTFTLSPAINTALDSLSKQTAAFATAMGASTFTLSPAINTALDSLSKQTAAFATAMGASTFTLSPKKSRTGTFLKIGDEYPSGMSDEVDFPALRPPNRRSFRPFSAFQPLPILPRPQLRHRSHPMGRSATPSIT